MADLKVRPTYATDMADLRVRPAYAIDTADLKIGPPYMTACATPRPESGSVCAAGAVAPCA